MFTYRKAMMPDIDTLIRLRLDYLTEDKGILSDADKTAIAAQLKGYFPQHIGKDFIAFVAESPAEGMRGSAPYEADDSRFYAEAAAGGIISCAFLVITEKPANPAFITGKTGTVLNVFTYPEYRRKGVATALLRLLIKDAKGQNLSYLELSATEAGKPLYEKLGFKLKQSKYTKMILVF